MNKVVQHPKLFHAVVSISELVHAVLSNPKLVHAVVSNAKSVKCKVHAILSNALNRQYKDYQHETHQMILCDVYFGDCVKLIFFSSIWASKFE